MADHKSRAHNTAASRARKRAEGLTAIEAVLHRDEVASLDQIKERLGAASRSEVLRVILAKMDPASLTPADVAALSRSAA